MTVPTISDMQPTRTILVTGGAGFIGSHVADVLLARGDRVIIVDELNDYYEVKRKINNLDYLVQKYGAKVMGSSF